MPPPLETSRVSIDVLLEAPEHYKNMNKEQNVAFPLGVQLHPCPDGKLALGAMVGKNSVRFASAELNDGKMVMNKSLNAAAREAQQKLQAYRVPIMLHNDPAVIVLTAVSATGAQLWTARFPYSIAALKLPAGEIASTWSVTKAAASADESDHMFCAIKMPEVAAEPQLAVGQQVTVEMAPVEGMTLILTLQRVVNGNTQEPLSFFVDRWWSLAKIALVAPPSRFGL